jgi:hypothetical protein
VIIFLVLTGAMFAATAVVTVGWAWMLVRAVEWRMGLRSPKETARPAPLDRFFDDHCCSDCGSAVDPYEDGGHDVAVQCKVCGARFGVQLSPLNLIERLGPSAFER